MTTPDYAADAAIGALAAPAFDMYANAPHLLGPPPDPRLLPAWILRGYLVANDVLWRPFSWLELGEKVCYGFLVESIITPGEFVAVIRGTASPAEWIIDSKFSQVEHPAGGHAEAGFWSVYQTMRYQPAQFGARDSEAGIGIASAIGQGTVTVVGHSLGAALATYLTLELANRQGMRGRVRGRYFASPRPGDQGFADAFAVNVTDAVAYVGQHDLVPEVPLGFGYVPLHCVQIIGGDIAQALIHDSAACRHHIYSYLSQLDWSLMDWSKVPACDESSIVCILGPAPSLVKRT